MSPDPLKEVVRSAARGNDYDRNQNVYVVWNANREMWDVGR